MPCLMRNGLNYTGGGGGTGSANIIELTQAEYDALGEEKNSNDTLYLITDGTPSTPTPTVDPAGIFSYEERRIGTWVDGKPLYRKMVDFGALPNNASKQVNHDIADVDHIHPNIGASYFKQSSIDNTYSIAHNEINGVYANKSVVYVAVNTVNLTNYNAMICIEYTKITDAAET